MKIIDDKTYSREFPETYPWGQCDKISAAEIGYQIQQAILRDLGLKTNARNDTPGLRRALNIMAAFYDL